MVIACVRSAAAPGANVCVALVDCTSAPASRSRDVTVTVRAATSSLTSLVVIDRSADSAVTCAVRRYTPAEAKSMALICTGLVAKRCTSR